MAKASKTTKSPLDKEYQKELRRIKQFMSRASKKGFIWLDNPIPKKPKTITEKSVERLKRRTSDYLYKKSKFVVEETGEVISYAKAKKLLNQKDTEKSKRKRKDTKPKEKKDTKPKEKKDTISNKKQNQQDTENLFTTSDDHYYPNFTPIVLTNVREQIDDYSPQPNWSQYWRQKKGQDVSALRFILERAISTHGENAVATRLEQEGSVRINYIVNSIMYDSDGGRTQYHLNEFATILNGAPLSPDEGKELAELAENSEWWEQPE